MVMVHEAHWARLAAAAPDDVCRRSGAQYDSARGCYTLPLLDRLLEIDPRACTVRWSEHDTPTSNAPGYEVALLAVVYLNEAKDLSPLGEWVTAESLPTGTFFFRGLHAIPTPGVAARFGQDRDLFLRTGGELKGEPAEGGDACLQFQVLPRIAVRLVLWLGDEEFPARVTMLFDRLVAEHVPLDALLSLARFVTFSMLRTADRPG